MKKTYCTYLHAGTKYSHVFEGHHFSKDNCQRELLKLRIGCSRVLSVRYA